MRPTWHFVAATDIRWLMTLTAPRVNAGMAYHFRQQELDAAIFSRSNKIFTKVLQGGKSLTRNELAAVLERDGIVGSNLRIGGIVGKAELDMVICNGPRRGKQFTYALFDERVPASKPRTREEALAELTRRYFVSHGPATLKDYVWWSGLTGTDAKTGIELVKKELVEEVVNGEIYWMSETAAVKSKSPIVHLLPNYDEYIVGYAERSAVYDTAHNDKLDSRGNFLFNYTIVLDGKVVGLWKRTFKRDTVTIEPSFFGPMTKVQMKAFEETAERYGVFVEMKMEIEK
jgi:hypothetical protein